MQPINMIMIYYRDKKLKKRLHVQETDIITIKKKKEKKRKIWCLSNKSLWY